MKLTRPLFGGYYGMRNVGDDCFAVVSTWGARTYWKSHRPALLSPVKLSGSIETNACLTPTNLFRGQRTLQAFRHILMSSCVVWAGGSILHSQPRPFRPLSLSLLGSRLGITPVAAIGVSLGPYETVADERFVHASLKKLSFLTLRDKRSYAEACSLDLPYEPVLAADLAMLLPRVCGDESPGRPGSPILGVVLCHYERYVGKNIENETRRESTILEALLSLTRGGFEGAIRFFVFNGHDTFGDGDITADFMSALKTAGARVELVPYTTDPISIWRKVAQCTAVISIRLHGGIFCAAADVPCCLVEYHRKCADFCSDVGTVDSLRVGDAQLSPGELAAALSKAISDQPADSYTRRHGLIEAAVKNFRFD